MKDARKGGVFHFAREQGSICMLPVKMRKPQVYFCSSKNDEEWPARFVSDGEQILVGEYWFAHTKTTSKKSHKLRLF